MNWPACVEILDQFAVDVAKAIATHNIEHMGALARNIQEAAKEARAYVIRTTDEDMQQLKREQQRQTELWKKG